MSYFVRSDVWCEIVNGGWSGQDVHGWHQWKKHREPRAPIWRGFSCGWPLGVCHLSASCEHASRNCTGRSQRGNGVAMVTVHWLEGQCWLKFPCPLTRRLLCRKDCLACQPILYGPREIFLKLHLHQSSIYSSNLCASDTGRAWESRSTSAYSRLSHECPV